MDDIESILKHKVEHSEEGERKKSVQGIGVHQQTEIFLNIGVSKHSSEYVTFWSWFYLSVSFSVTITSQKMLNMLPLAFI